MCFLSAVYTPVPFFISFEEEGGKKTNPVCNAVQEAWVHLFITEVDSWKTE